MCTSALFVLALLTGIGLAGCSGGAGGIPEPPEGWQHVDGRWWRAGVDTTQAFRDLSGAEAMGITSGASASLTAAVQRELLPLYRNQPEVIDSLFERHVAEKLAEGEGDVEEWKRRAYSSLRKNFREPLIATHLGSDIPVPYPDSLRSRGVTGKVTMQVRLDAEGRPQAIELIEPVHPALDAIAMQATTQMKWRPAYVMRNGRWRAIPSWVRFSVNFRT